MSDRFLEQRINIKFCVTSSLEIKHGAFNVIPKANDKVCNANSRIATIQVRKHVEITNEVNAHRFLRYHGHSSLRIHSTRSVNQAYYVEILKQLCEAVRRKWPELWSNGSS
jgi:hypothetical protein